MHKEEGIQSGMGSSANFRWWDACISRQVLENIEIDFTLPVFLSPMSGVKSGRDF